ncbi:MAG: hypothetical protein JWN93_487 [Hyphomicrobiales bacterium]|nr:hypothetical protein [Hyphomicrobiales bacterium]
MTFPTTSAQAVWLAARTGLLAAILCGLVSLAGCAEYLDRREAITAHVGDAVRANVAVNVIDPWPREASERSMRLGARRAIAAIERYNVPPVLVGGPLPPPGGPMGPPPVPPVVR